MATKNARFSVKGGGSGFASSGSASGSAPGSASGSANKNDDSGIAPDVASGVAPGVASDVKDKQLVVSEGTTPHLAPGERPVIVFNALTDAQFDKALALFAPPPRTKPNLWVQKEYTKNLIKAASYCEAVMFMRPNGGCFGSRMVSNNFDNCMIQKFKNGDEDFFFSVDEWFNTTRGEVPEVLKNWDPQGSDPMPQVDTGVDWYARLTAIDMEYNGFLDLFANCIDMEEEMAKEVSQRKHAASTAFGDHPGTRMPDPINQIANFDNFTPSGLLSGMGNGMKFPTAKGGFGPGRYQ